MKICNNLLALLFGGVMLSSAHAAKIYVAVATNFAAPMNELVGQFEAASKHKVIVSLGSSGKFFAQIQHGAPFQVFLSADQTKPIALEEAGLVVPESRFTYAVGALALWSTRPDYVDANYTPLKSGAFDKLALANPKLAPYGIAAVEVLEALQLKQATEAKWVLGENIAQTYQFVATGNADLGFVALSQIMAAGHVAQGSTRIIPKELYDPIRQDAVLLTRARDNPGAKALLDFLRSDAARAIIHSYGYTTESPQ